MKKYFSIILIALIAIIINSCSAYPTFDTKDWFGYELPPSKIVNNGEVFFEGKLYDGSMFSVFSDEKISADANYYQVLLWQDFGWTLKDDKTWTAPPGSRERKHGYIYINPIRKVAVYFYPERTYSAFKVNINK